MKKILLIIILIISSCTRVSETYAPDGRKAYSISCSGWAHSWADCQDQAGKSCKSYGYDVLDQFSEDWEGQDVKTKKRTMLIACKKD